MKFQQTQKNIKICLRKKRNGKLPVPPWSQEVMYRVWRWNSTKWRGMVSFMLWSLYPWKNFSQNWL